MNRETIEKAAREFTDNLIAENYFDVNYEEDNYDAGSLNATDEVGFNAFIKGGNMCSNVTQKMKYNNLRPYKHGGKKH